MESKFKLYLIAFFLLFWGCVTATTKPNPIYTGPYPAVFYNLKNKNPLLANELGKLPEIQDGISTSEADALKKIIDLYNNDPELFEKVFQDMYQVGKPEVRKYCTPLQALFWLVEDGKSSDLSALLNQYHLVDLLEKAWDFENEHEGKGICLPEKKAKEVVTGLKLGEEDKKGYIYSEGGLKMVNRLILVYDFIKNPNIFSEKSKKIMQEGFKKYKLRWNFDATTSRLNSPELIDYFTRNAFVYEAYTSKSGSASWAFKKRGGNCVEIEAFQRHCLNKAGYEARLVEVEPSSSWAQWHNITKFFVDGKMYLMDNGKPTPKGIMGPCQSIEEHGYKLHFR